MERMKADNEVDFTIYVYFKIWDYRESPAKECNVFKFVPNFEVVSTNFNKFEMRMITS